MGLLGRREAARRGPLALMRDAFDRGAVRFPSPPHMDHLSLISVKTREGAGPPVYFSVDHANAPDDDPAIDSYPSANPNRSGDTMTKTLDGLLGGRPIPPELAQEVKRLGITPDDPDLVADSLTDGKLEAARVRSSAEEAKRKGHHRSLVTGEWPCSCRLSSGGFKLDLDGVSMAQTVALVHPASVNQCRICGTMRPDLAGACC